jgi:uncharacterized protein YndB with AHSA1/START domain
MAEAGIVMTRVFDAPRERIWQEWTEPERFADWFGGPDWEVPLSTVVMDVRDGGRLRLTMRLGAHEIHWKGEYLHVDEPERLIFKISDRPDERYELVTVELVDLGDGRTEMHFEQRGHMRPDQYRATREGWSGFFDRVDARLVTP